MMSRKGSLNIINQGFEYFCMNLFTSLSTVVWLVPMETHIEARLAIFESSKRKIYFIIISYPTRENSIFFLCDARGSMLYTCCKMGRMCCPIIGNGLKWWYHHCSGADGGSSQSLLCACTCVLWYLGSQGSDGLLPVRCTITCSCSGKWWEISQLFAGSFPLPIPT